MFTKKINENISLKLTELKDAYDIFQLIDESRSYLRQWLPWLDNNQTVKDTENFIKESIRNYAEQKSVTTVILYQNKVVGIAGFNEIDWSNKMAYIGYWLGEKYQGYGIMTKVCETLTNYALQDLNLNKVDIRAAVENAKSRAIPERLGFTMEGRIRQNEWLYDHFVDHVVYGMLAQEWNERMSTLE